MQPVVSFMVQKTVSGPNGSRSSRNVGGYSIPRRARCCLGLGRWTRGSKHNSVPRPF